MNPLVWDHRTGVFDMSGVWIDGLRYPFVILMEMYESIVLLKGLQFFHILKDDHG